MVALAAALLFEKTATQQDSMLANWSSTGALAWPLRVTCGGAQFAVEATLTGRGGFSIALGGKRVAIDILDRRGRELRFAVDGLQLCAHFVFADDMLHLDVAGNIAAFRESTREAVNIGSRRAGSQLLAPMNGAVVAVLAKVGDSIKKGQRIVIVEAMKMQHEIAAERDGILARIHVKAGDQVATRQLLGELQEPQTGSRDPERQASGRTS
jgi:geranyl-CoA carboxylase alpha subunit